MWRLLVSLALWALALPLWAAGSIRTGTIRTGEATAGTITITNFNVPADASNAVLWLCIGGTGSDTAGVTEWNGVGFDLAEFDIQGTTSAEVWYIIRPTVNTTSDITITPNGTGNYAAIAAVLEGLLDTGLDSTGLATGTATSLTGSVSTASASALIVDCLAAASGISNPAVTQAGQAERQQFNPTITTPVVAISDKQGAVTPGGTNLGWNGLQNATRTIQVLTTFPAAPPAATTKDMIQPGIINGPR